MSSVRFFLVLFALLLAGWRIFSWVSFDVDALQMTIPPGVPARYVVRDEESLQHLRERLGELETFSPVLTKRLSLSDTGRSQLFVPDQPVKETEKKILGSS